MMSFPRVAVILFAVVLLGACAAPKIKIGRDFDVNAFATKVQQGVTTKDQITSWLGDPGSVGASMDRVGEPSDEWDYYFAEGDLANMSTANVKILQIRFDQNGTVRSYNWSVSKK